jgi:hypothetical protein
MELIRYIVLKERKRLKTKIVGTDGFLKCFKQGLVTREKDFYF